MSYEGDRVLIDRKLSEVSDQHVIDVAFERVDVAGWLFSLPNLEYRRCCMPDHLACGSTTTDEGQPMSIHVETIAGSLLVQQYVAHVHRCDRCELVSLSDVFPRTGGRTRAQVSWILSVEALDDDRSTYTNTIIAYATEDYMHFLDGTGTSFEAAAAAGQAASADHNRRETPRYAESIARWSRLNARLAA
jgi:hypothetical protein